MGPGGGVGPGGDGGGGCVAGYRSEHRKNIVVREYVPVVGDVDQPEWITESMKSAAACPVVSSIRLARARAMENACASDR